MQVAIQLPEDLARILETRWGSLARRVLESLAVEAYRVGHLTAHQVQQLLNMESRWDVEAFLQSHEAHIPYTMKDLDQDRESLHRLGLS